MSVQPGFFIIDGWVSRAEMYFSGYNIKNLPIQNDMVNGRIWYRPDDNADVLYPVKTVDTTIGARFGYGGIKFTWKLQALSPLAVKYIQDTYFTPTIGNSSFYQRSWSNKLTVQTYNRASGEWETYHTYTKFANLLDEAEALMGGYHNLSLSHHAVKQAPDGPDISITTTNSTHVQMLLGTISINVDNVGDTSTFNNTRINWQVPTGVTLQSVNNTNWDSTVYYSTNGTTYSTTPPSPISNTTHLRITIDTELDAGEDTGYFIITVRPDEDAVSFVNTVTVQTDGDDLLTGNNIATTSINVNTFTPLALMPTLWLDADEDVYQEYTPPISLNATDGVVVDGWIDISGNNRIYQQTTPANKPIYRINQNNGRSAVDFDGIDNFMVSTNYGTAIDTENTTLIMVVDPSNSSSSPSYEVLFSTTTGNVWAHKSNTGSLDKSGVLQGEGGLSQEWSELSPAQSGIQILVFTTYSNNSITLHRNTVLAGTDTNTKNMFGIRNSRIGASTLTPAGYFDGLIYETIGFNSALTDNNRNAIEYYLINKYTI